MQDIILLNQIVLEQATAAEAGAGGWLGMLITFAPMILLVVLMYFMLIRPQRKEEKKKREQLEAMRVGDQIITIGGVVGRVVNIKDDEVTISTSVANTVLTFRKAAIDKVISPISEEDL